MHDIELNRVTKSFGDLLAVDDVSAVAATEEVGRSRRPANSDRFATAVETAQQRLVFGSWSANAPSQSDWRDGGRR
jgi:hypothetical protein